VLTIAGVEIGKAILDTGAQPVIVGRQVKSKLIELGVGFESIGLRLSQAGGGKSDLVLTSTDSLGHHHQPRDTHGSNSLGAGSGHRGEYL